uniref:BdrA3- n=1 Tax=Borrelia hermsii TaxID=140 RepID=Q9RG82_BORHE|nr:BdrA3- [Borrelia hermsii]
MSDFNSFLTLSILMLRLFSTVSILLSSSLNLVSIFTFKLFSTVLILLSSSLNLVSILLSRSLISDFKFASTLLISACKVASTFSSFISKFSFKNSISL